MAKMGRPSVENGLVSNVQVRFTAEEHQVLTDYAKEHNVSIAEVVRTEVRKLIKEISNK